MDETDGRVFTDEYSILFSDDELNLFGEHSFEFNFSDLSTGTCVALDLPGAYSSESGPSYDVEHRATLDTASTAKSLESFSDDDCVVLSPFLMSNSTTTSSDTTAVSACDSKNHVHATAESKKRKWESSVVVFSTNPDTKVKCRRRREFDEARRKEIALNRVIGACIQCKLRKGSVCLHCFTDNLDYGL